LSLPSVFLALVCQGATALAQSFQGPTGANYAAVQTLFGLTGDGVTIAIIEWPPGGPGITDNHHLGTRLAGQWDFNGRVPPLPLPPFDVSGCPPANQPPAAIPNPSSQHATLVANVAAGGPFGPFVGAAPLANVVAGHLGPGIPFGPGYEESRAAMQWIASNNGPPPGFAYLLPQNPSIFNASYGYPGIGADTNGLALFLDWASTAGGIGPFAVAPLFVVAAGDDVTMIRAPGDLYNGITVGATDASLNRRALFSSHELDAPGARCKPDILAPGTGVSDGVTTSDGNSFAAPQVSGTAALLRENGLVNAWSFALAAKAIILNSARKRFISGLNAENGVSRDHFDTDTDETDYDYLSGGALAVGGSGSGPKTENWTPAVWSKAAGGPFLATRPLDDEQGAGLLDAARAVTQMAGPNATGAWAPDWVVPLIGWSFSWVGPGTATREYSVADPVPAQAFLTATLVWQRTVNEVDAGFFAPLNPLPPAPPSCPPNSAGGTADFGDNYVAQPLDNLDLEVFGTTAAGGMQLIARSASTVDTVEHLHIPLPADASDFVVRVVHQPPLTMAINYALAWWIGVPPPPVVAGADLAVKKTANPSPVILGAPLTYTLTVTNQGPSASTGVILTDVLPANVVFLWATPSAGSWTFTPIANPITPGFFAPAVHLLTGDNPYSVAAGDLNGDGKPDLVSANYLGYSVSVLGNASVNGALGAASFAPKVDFNIGVAAPSGVAIGDLDGDSKRDIAVANGVDLSVFRNTSSGGNLNAASFAAPVEYATGMTAASVAIGDLDGDLKPELVTANINGDSVSVLRNNTSAPGALDASSFGPHFDLPSGDSANGVAIGDIDGDGKPDLAVANSSSGTVSVWRNISTTSTLDPGSFGPKVDLAAGLTPVYVALGDLNGDGKTDIAVSNAGDQNVAVFRNIGTSENFTAASFAPNITLDSGPGTFALALRDVNSDGRPDLVAAIEATNYVSVLRNMNPGGTLTWDLGNLAAGGSTTMTVLVQPIAPGGLTGGIWITNTASVTALTSDPQPTNNIATAVALLVPPPTLTISLVANGVAISFATQVGYTYMLESTASLSNPTWTVLQAAAGTGNVVTLVNTPLAAQARFYRVSVWGVTPTTAASGS
jgi:uncharacterized repeat protein (TIGR01451 family)